jgi:uncharacterized RDD family membrane protein YckC
LYFTPASPTARAYSWAIDTAIFGLFMLIASLLISSFGSAKLSNGIMLVLLFVSYWGYPILCEIYNNGQTIGKRLMHLRVIRDDGLPVGWRESSLRNLLLVADFLPLLYLSGLVCMLFDIRFRRLGDLVAGTLVVYHEKPAPRSPPQHTPPIPLPYSLTPEQQRALVDLFEREASLPAARLAELGSIAEPLTACSGADSLDQMRGYVAGILK